MQPEPAACNGALDAGAEVFASTTREKRGVAQLIRPATSVIGHNVNVAVMNARKISSRKLRTPRQCPHSPSVVPRIGF